MPTRIPPCALLLALVAVISGCAATDNANFGNSNASTASVNAANSNSATANAANTPPAGTGAYTGATGASYNNSSVNTNTYGGGVSNSGHVNYNSQNSNYQASPSPTPSPRLRNNKPTRAPADKSLDDNLAKLPLGEVAFNVPEKMMLHETTTIDLKVGGPKLVGKLEELIEGEGKIESHPIKFAGTMEAELTGTNFEITPNRINPQQPTSIDEPTEWKWGIKAKERGKHSLILTLNVVIKVDGKERSRTINIFQKEIPVEVTTGTLVKEFFSNNFGPLIVGLIVVVAAALLNKRFRRRKVKLPTSTPPAT